MTRLSRSARRPLLAALAASLVVSSLSVSLFGSSASATEPTPHTPVFTGGSGGERYVAFGDSFVSGPGIPEQWGGGCARSTQNFPAVVARTLAVSSFVDASCAGARTEDFWAAQTQGGTTVAPQLDALSADTTLVTFGTMGGNDIGLVQLAMACADPDTSCAPADGTDPLAEKFAKVRTDLTAAMAETQRRAPKADVMVIGYGTYMPPGGCPDSFFGALTSGEFDYVQDQIDRLSDILRDVAAEAGAHFVDQREIPGALDHTVCQWPAQQWIRGINSYDDGYPFHPSTAGMAATGAFVVAQVAEMRDKGEHVTPPEPTPPTPAQIKAARLKALKAKAKTVKLSASCHGSTKKGTVRLRVRGGSGAVAKVEFRAGKKRVSTDRKSPFTVTKKSSTLRKALAKKKSKVTAKVTLKDGSLTYARTVTLAKRPRCLR